MNIGSKIRKLREEKGIEQLELALKIDISQSKMNKIETGYQKRIETDILVAISDALGVTTDYQLGKSSHPSLREKDMDDPEFVDFVNDVRRWYKEAPKD